MLPKGLADMLGDVAQVEDAVSGDRVPVEKLLADDPAVERIVGVHLVNLLDTLLNTRLDGAMMSAVLFVFPFITMSKLLYRVVKELGIVFFQESSRTLVNLYCAPPGAGHVSCCCRNQPHVWCHETPITQQLVKSATRGGTRRLRPVWGPPHVVYRLAWAAGTATDFCYVIRSAKKHEWCDRHSWCGPLGDPRLFVKGHG